MHGILPLQCKLQSSIRMPLHSGACTVGDAPPKKKKRCEAQACLTGENM